MDTKLLAKLFKMDQWEFNDELSMGLILEFSFYESLHAYVGYTYNSDNSKRYDEDIRYLMDEGVIVKHENKYYFRLDVEI